jgi:hypothetical protein
VATTTEPSPPIHEDEQLPMKRWHVFVMLYLLFDYPLDLLFCRTIWANDFADYCGGLPSYWPWHVMSYEFYRIIVFWPYSLGLIVFAACIGRCMRKNRK